MPITPNHSTMTGPKNATTRVSGNVEGGRLAFEVSDEGPGFDPENAVSPGTDGSGWGLFLVERLAHRWGVSQHEHATRVWFELRRG